MSLAEKQVAPFQGQRFDGIQVLRAVAALTIFAHHMVMFRSLHGGLYTYRGADIFFVISGFLMMYATQKGVKDYWKKRLVKIIPLYWMLTLAAFFASYIVEGVTDYIPTVTELVKSMLFIPYVRIAIDEDTAIRPIVGPAHTLLYEMLFYLIFYVAARVSHKRRGLITIVVLLAMIFVGANLDPFRHVLLTKYLNGRWYDFVVGILLFYVVRGIYQRPQWLDIADKLSIPLLLAACTGIYALAVWDTSLLNVAILTAAIVLGFILAFCRRKGPGWLIAVGNMSYSFYLLHFFVLLAVGKFLTPLDTWTVKSVIGMLVALLLSLAASYVSYRLIEVRLAAWLRDRLNRLSWPTRRP